MADPLLGASASSSFRYVQWGPIFAGALAAAALAFVLHSFAGAVGLAVSSTAPTWRDASVVLWVLSGIWLVVVAVAAYGLGGYVAGRMRQGLIEGNSDEREFRDGVHGLLVWALATLLTALLAVAAAEGLARLTAPSSGANGTTPSAGESLLAYELDRLFRTDRPIPDLAPKREEAARILLTAGTRDGVTAEDRNYLAGLVAARTGIPEAEAQQRTQNAIARASESIKRARHSGTLLAFFAGAAAMIGAAAAWFAAGVGGEHRDSGKIPSLAWGTHKRQVAPTAR
jgi:hypothetical protein